MNTDDTPPLTDSMIRYHLENDLPLPLKYWDHVISRTEAFRAAREGLLKIEIICRTACLRGSAVKRHLNRSNIAPSL